MPQPRHAPKTESGLLNPRRNKVPKKVKRAPSHVCRVAINVHGWRMSSMITKAAWNNCSGCNTGSSSAWNRSSLKDHTLTLVAVSVCPLSHFTFPTPSKPLINDCWAQGMAHQQPNTNRLFLEAGPRLQTRRTSKSHAWAVD